MHINATLWRYLFRSATMDGSSTLPELATCATTNLDAEAPPLVRKQHELPLAIRNVSEAVGEIRCMNTILVRQTSRTDSSVEACRDQVEQARVRVERDHHQRAGLQEAYAATEDNSYDSARDVLLGPLEKHKQESRRAQHCLDELTHKHEALRTMTYAASRMYSHFTSRLKYLKSDLQRVDTELSTYRHYIEG